MVAIEHRQKSAIIATDTTTTSTSATTTTTTAAATLTPTEAAIASTENSTSPLAIEEITADTRRSSDIENSNSIANDIVVSPTSSANSSIATAITIATPEATRSDTSDNTAKEEVMDLEKIPNANMSQSSSEASTVTVESAAQMTSKIEPTVSKSAVSQRNVDIKIGNKSNKDAATQELSKKVLQLDLSGKELDEFSIKSPRSPIATRLPHQSSLTTVDVEDRKTLREALYQGIFHRHRRTIFAVGSFLRMLRSRNSSYNTIRSSSEGEEVDEAR